MHISVFTWISLSLFRKAYYSVARKSSRNMPLITNKYLSDARNAMNMDTFTENVRSS